MMTIKMILEIIKNAQSIVISAHTNPDGDAIGAMVAMGHLCAYYKKTYTILLEQPSQRFSKLFEKCHYTMQLNDEVNSVDTFIAVDCGNLERLVGHETYFQKAKNTINVDHHISNTQFAQYNYVDAQASSTSELIYRVLKEGHIPINVEMAEALYIGLLTDTSGFRHSCTNPSTLLAAAELIQLPFNFSKVYENTLCEQSLATAKLQAKAVERIKQLGKKGIYLTYITFEDLIQSEASKEDIDGVVNYLKTIRGIELIAFIYPKEPDTQTYKVSMRSNPPFNVATFCEQFKGGGHERAAGATLKGTLEEVLKRIEDAICVFVES